MVGPPFWTSGVFRAEEAKRCPSCGGKADEPAVRTQDKFSGSWEECCENEFHETEALCTTPQHPTGMDQEGER